MRLYVPLIAFLFLLCWDSPQKAWANEYSFTTGAEYGGGTVDPNAVANLGANNPNINATGSAASENVTPIAEEKTQAQITADRILNQPFKTPSWTVGSNNVGTTFAPRTETQLFPLGPQGVLTSPMTFNTEDYFSFTPLELAEVNGVKGYIGSASRGKIDFKGRDGRPQQFFVPANRMSDYMQSEARDVLEKIRQYNRTYNNHSAAECTDPSHDHYQEEIVEQTAIERIDGYLPGCQALAIEGGPTRAEETMLQECIQSIKTAAAQHSRNSQGSLVREAWMCQVMAQLNPKEQEFAGLVFTAATEAGTIGVDTPTGEPRWKETLFVQKVIQNRARQMRESLKSDNFNSLDAAFAYKQFSVFNSSEFNKFRHYFDPKSSQGRAQVTAAVRSFIALNEHADLIQPQPEVDRMDMYFSPYGMAKGSGGSRLVRMGKAPSDYPDNRIKPGWDFSQLNWVKDLNFDGRPVRDQGCGGGNCHGYHAFYSRRPGAALQWASDHKYYGSRIPDEYERCGSPSSPQDWVVCRREKMCVSPKTDPDVTVPRPSPKTPEPPQDPKKVGPQ